MDLTEDDLEAWRANPVTERVLAALDRYASSRMEAVQAELWTSLSPADPDFVRRRDLALAWRETVSDLREMKAEDIHEWSDD